MLPTYLLRAAYSLTFAFRCFSTADKKSHYSGSVVVPDTDSDPAFQVNPDTDPDPAFQVNPDTDPRC